MRETRLLYAVGARVSLAQRVESFLIRTALGMSMDRLGYPFTMSALLGLQSCLDLSAQKFYGTLFDSSSVEDLSMSSGVLPLPKINPPLE